jgi:hypothetical protein
MPLRPSDIIGPVILATVLFGLIAILLIANVPVAEAG